MTGVVIRLRPDAAQGRRAAGNRVEQIGIRLGSLGSVGAVNDGCIDERGFLNPLERWGSRRGRVIHRRIIRSVACVEHVVRG